MINKKYEYLNDVTDGMIEDVGKYQLEEEKNKSYRSIEYEVPVKYLKKWFILQYMGQIPLSI